MLERSWVESKRTTPFAAKRKGLEVATNALFGGAVGRFLMPGGASILRYRSVKVGPAERTARVVPPSWARLRKQFWLSLRRLLFLDKIRSLSHMTIPQRD
jgi:hypothetical protein